MTQICCRCQQPTRKGVEVAKDAANVGGLPLYLCSRCWRKPKHVPFVRRCSG